jgi:hypothetical protein
VLAFAEAAGDGEFAGLRETLAVTVAAPVMLAE